MLAAACIDEAPEHGSLSEQGNRSRVWGSICNLGSGMRHHVYYDSYCDWYYYKITCAIMLITITMTVATLRESLLLLLLSSIWISWILGFGDQVCG